MGQRMNDESTRLSLLWFPGRGVTFYEESSLFFFIPQDRMFQTVLTPEHIQEIHGLATVIHHRSQLGSQSNVRFTCALSDEIRAAIHAKLGLDLSQVAEVPMRWIQGDTVPHVDVSQGTFEHTYLVYVSSSQGEFVLGDQSYPICEGAGIQFYEGISHKTVGTGSEPRLLIGPMNELGLPVGSALSYYGSEADALNTTNIIGYGTSFIIESFNGITAWRLASNSNGSSSQSATYYVGDALNQDGNYYLYPNAPCLLEGTMVMCQIDGVDQEIPIEQIRRGMTIKTAGGYKRVELIGRSPIHNSGSSERSQHRLYVCRTDRYPELKTDLYLTGCHSILVNRLTTDQIEQTKALLGDIYVTGQKYRLMACIDERAEPWASEGTYTVWHLAVENQHPRANEGIFVNGGLLVESCSLQYLQKHSNMELIH